MNKEAYEKGREALREKDYKAAVRDFEEVLKDLDEHHESYNRIQASLGLAQVLTSNRNGLLLCRDAASSEGQDGNVFLHLASAEWHFGNRKRAIDALRHGMKIEPGNQQLKRAIGMLDARKKSVFEFLPRNHSLNRTLGRFLRRDTDDPSAYHLLY